MMHPISMRILAISAIAAVFVFAWFLYRSFRRGKGRINETAIRLADELGGLYNAGLDKIEWQRGVVSMHLWFRPPMKISAIVPATLRRLEVKGSKNTETKGEDLTFLPEEENPLRQGVYHEKGVDPKAFLTDRVVKNIDLIYRLLVFGC